MYRFLPVAIVLSALVTSSVSAAPIYFGPTPYLSAGDIPAGFYAGGVPTALETFEDGTLDFGITASPGSLVIPPSCCPAEIDSVDGDDGVIDGSGVLGHSWFFFAGTPGITFTFSGPLPTAAGIVWTDGAGPTTFEAFGPGMVSLGTIGPVMIADASIFGTTAEDHFFGVQDLGGILAIKLSNVAGGIEVDHVQFGAAALVPVPAAAWLFGSALGLLGWVTRVKGPGSAVA